MHYRVPEGSPVTNPVAMPEATLPRRRSPWLVLGALFGLLTLLVACLLELVENGHELSLPALLLGLAALLTLATTFSVMVLRILRINRENEAAVVLLASGRTDEAIARFAQLIERARRYPNVRAALMANLGVAWLRKGELERALAYLRAVLESKQLETPQYKLHHALLLQSLALTHLARGELSVAQAFYRGAEAGIPETHRGHLVLGGALVAAYAEDFASVVALTGARWSEAEGVAGALQMRLLRLVRAYALTRLDANAHGAELASLVSNARPANPSEFDYLLGQWPALRAFFAAQGFASV